MTPSLSAQDFSLVLGALDSLAVALVDHDHEWTVGEREIYEQAVALCSGHPRIQGDRGYRRYQP